MDADRYFAPSPVLPVLDRSVDLALEVAPDGEYLRCEFCGVVRSWYGGPGCCCYNDHPNGGCGSAKCPAAGLCWFCGDQPPTHGEIEPSEPEIGLVPVCDLCR